MIEGVCVQHSVLLEPVEDMCIGFGFGEAGIFAYDKVGTEDVR